MKRKSLIALILIFIAILMEACSTLNKIAEDPYVQESYKKAYKNFYGTEYPY